MKFPIRNVRRRAYWHSVNVYEETKINIGEKKRRTNGKWCRRPWPSMRVSKFVIAKKKNRDPNQPPVTVIIRATEPIWKQKNQKKNRSLPLAKCGPLQPKWRTTTNANVSTVVCALRNPNRSPPLFQMSSSHAVVDFLHIFFPFIFCCFRLSWAAAILVQMCKRMISNRVSHFISIKAIRLAASSVYRSVCPLFSFFPIFFSFFRRQVESTMSLRWQIASAAGWFLSSSGRHRQWLCGRWRHVPSGIKALPVDASSWTLLRFCLAPFALLLDCVTL